MSKKPQLGGTGLGRRENVQCYAYELREHFARDCPNKTGYQEGSRNTGNKPTAFKLEQAVSEGRREACTGRNGQFEINKGARDDVIKSIKVTRKLPDGIYIRGTVQGYPLLLLLTLGHPKQ